VGDISGNHAEGWQRHDSLARHLVVTATDTIRMAIWQLQMERVAGRLGRPAVDEAIRALEPLIAWPSVYSYRAELVEILNTFLGKELCHGVRGSRDTVLGSDLARYDSRGRSLFEDAGQELTRANAALNAEHAGVVAAGREEGSNYWFVVAKRRWKSATALLPWLGHPTVQQYVSDLMEKAEDLERRGIERHFSGSDTLLKTAMAKRTRDGQIDGAAFESAGARLAAEVRDLQERFPERAVPAIRLLHERMELLGRYLLTWNAEEDTPDLTVARQHRDYIGQLLRTLVPYLLER
jgi:hypothetical protein